MLAAPGVATAGVVAGYPSEHLTAAGVLVGPGVPAAQGLAGEGDPLAVVVELRAGAFDLWDARSRTGSLTSSDRWSGMIPTGRCGSSI